MSNLLQKLPFVPSDADRYVAALAAEFESLHLKNLDCFGLYRNYLSYNQISLQLFTYLSDPLLDYDQRRVSKRGPERHDIKLPFGQALTVKHTFAVAGRMPEVVVDRREETEEERHRSDTMEKIVWGVLRESKGEAQFSSGAWDGSQLGSTVFEVYWNLKKKKPCFRTTDPTNTFVVKGMDDPHDFERVFRFWDVPAESLKTEYEGKMFRDEMIDVNEIGTDQVRLVQITDRERIVRFALSGQNRPVGLYEYQHGFGFCNFTVIPNLGPERDIWGWADYEFVRGLLAYLPQLFSREADILRSVAGGSYMDKRSGADAKKIAGIIAEGGVVPIRRDGSIEPIQSPDVPAFAADHSATAMQYLKMLGFAPDAAWGDSAATSGSDRGLQMQPVKELAALKQINWSSGLSRLFGMCFQMIEQRQVGTARYSGVKLVGNGRQPFNMKLDANAAPKTMINPDYNPDDQSSLQDIEVPQSPKEIFDGDYEVRFTWLHRVDPQDPAYVMSELNKFEQGAQSLRTTLENLGHDAPEDEIKLIEQEAQDHPWLRQGMIALLKQQLDSSQQGQGGGPTPDPGTGLDSALATMQTPEGNAQDANAGVQGLSGGVNQQYGAK